MTEPPTEPLPIVGALRWAASQAGDHRQWWWPWLHLVPADAPDLVLPDGSVVRLALCGLATIVAPVAERDARVRCVYCQNRQLQSHRVLADIRQTDFTPLMGQAIGAPQWTL